MHQNNLDFQPGLLLHQTLLAAFRLNGSSLNVWCVANGLTQTTVRSATHGLSSGKNGQAMLDRIIDAAGRDLVEQLYARRMQEEAAKVA